MRESQAAGEYLEQALPIIRRTQSQESLALADANAVQGSYLLALGRHEDAEPYLLESLRIIRRLQGDQSIYSWHALQRALHLYEAWGSEEKLEEFQALAEQLTPVHLEIPKNEK